MNSPEEQKTFVIILTHTHTHTAPALTDGVLQIAMRYELQELLDGFGGQRVFSEDQVLAVDEAIHLAHGHVRQEVLKHTRDTQLTSVT